MRKSRPSQKPYKPPIKKLTLSLLVLALIGAVAVPLASAAPVQVFTRGALGANDFKDWSTLGPANTNVTNPFTTTSNGSLSFITSQATSSRFRRVDEGTAAWGGNFAPGDALIWTNGANGPITMTFAAPIFGVGFQIQADFFGAFTASLQAFDSLNNSLGLFSVNGTSDSTGDNSAVFLGMLDSIQEISRIVISVPVSANPQDFGINLMSLRRGALVQGVPETGASLLLLGLGLAGLLAAQRTFRARKIA